MDLGEVALMKIKDEVEDLPEDIPEFVKIKQEIADTQEENLESVPCKVELNTSDFIENVLDVDCQAQVGKELPQYVGIKQENDLDEVNVANTSIEIKEEQESTNTKVKKRRARLTVANVSVKCEVCGVICKDRRSYKLHVMDHTGRPFKCDKCDKSYKKSTDLLYHMKAHTGDHDIHCEACGKGFAVKSALRAHMRTHSQEKPYICPICNRGFSHSSSLKPHIAMHNEDYPYVCDRCPKKFKTKKALNSHKRQYMEGDKGEQCSFCPKFYKSKEGLKLHLNRHKHPLTSNTNPLIYTCEQCGNSYKHAVSLKNHLRSHNGNKFACHKCGKSYITIKLLDIHVRNHTGETPFSCTVCGKKFKRRDSWLYHKTTHQNDRKTYECDMCDKVLVCKSSLRVHKTYTHSNAKPHRCDFCFQSFKLRYDLTRHLRKHKKDDEGPEERQDGDGLEERQGGDGLEERQGGDGPEERQNGDAAKAGTMLLKGNMEYLGEGLDNLVDVIKMYKCKCKILFDNESEFKKHKLDECEFTKIGNGSDKSNEKDETKPIKEEVVVKTEGSYEDS